MYSQMLMCSVFCVHKEGLFWKEFEALFCLCVDHSAILPSALYDWEPFINFLGDKNFDYLTVVDFLWGCFFHICV